MTATLHDWHALHHLAEGGGATCGVSERRIQTRSAGASSDWSRVTCAACIEERPVGSRRDDRFLALSSVAYPVTVLATSTLPTVTGENITDEQIRELRRAIPEMLDALMVAIHSTDPELRELARRDFADAWNAWHGGGR